MKNTFKRILSITMAMVMVLTFSVTALAAPVDIDSADGDFGAPTSSSGPDYTKVTFVAGVGYELTAQKGTSTNKNGDVVVEISGSKVNEKRIPEVTAADEYYDVYGWAVMNKDGELEEIDLEEYKFTKNTKVYALVEDLWVPYKDMNQDRLDWYYRYVRDLSVRGVVGGNPDYTFNPKGNTTWGEALKLVMLATGYDEQAPVDAHWASGYLAKALEDGLVEAEQNIVLNAPVTRLEYATLAAIAMGLEESDIKTPFIDTEDGLVLALYEIGIFEGSLNKDKQRVFLPDDYIIRSEISTVIWRINNYYNAQ